MAEIVFLFDDDDVNVVVGNNNVIHHAVEYALADMPQVERVAERLRPVRNADYYEAVIPLYNLDEFREHFRMSREHMDNVLLSIGAITALHNPNIPLEKNCWLQYGYWQPETFLACGDRFGLARSTTHYVFREIVSALAQLANQVIVWPNAHQCRDNAEIFFEKSQGIPNVIGAIDGSHIFIKQPVGNAVDYYNRYQKHSVVIQAVCNPHRRFLNISVGHPGRMHDARIFRRSELYQAITQNENPLIKDTQHIIGDCAYPLLQEVLTPFRNTGHLTPAQQVYNMRFSQIRAVIERAFGLLKGKWRRLKYLDMSDLNLMNEVIASCCVLHNLVLDDADFDADDIFEEVDDPEPVVQLNERRRHALGEAKRTKIVNMLNN